MKHHLLAGLVLATTTWSAAAQEFEVTFSFYLQLDSSGANTENRSITLEEGVLELEAHNADESVYTEREATQAERDSLLALAREQFAGVTLTAGPDLDYPYVEVAVEFDGDSVAMELEYDFAPGTVPQVFVDLQEQFFAGAFR